MQKVEDITKWLEENVPAVEYGEIHVVIRKHQGAITDTKMAISIKGQCPKNVENSEEGDYN